ncbi:MAG TPA: UDP-N-acetylglucosamine 2-epimerase (non-hydrolyzing) [Bryobacteraceae bacterium]|nr:UDP-N-acetylglucosamine 2-epimerase (non-hydrolyzing) [Bryobacteraceae bacterium]
MTIKILCVAGARPNFMKLGPLVAALSREPDFAAVLVHTGQHYDDQMSGHFFRDLALPQPKFNLSVGSGTHAQQTAEIMKRFEPVALEEKPDAVLVVGDVNSTMACALVAKKLTIPVVHVEAGLRSFDRSMPEEINRVVTDAISDLLLVTEESGRRNLIAEGIAPDRIHMVGNLMIDSLRASLANAVHSDILSRIGAVKKSYGLVTLHRPSNVDDGTHLAEIADTLSTIARELPLYFPVHPRTRARLEDQAIALDPALHLTEPLGYLDFLWLMSNSSAVLTDSGGIQEETTVLGIPCLTLRDNTERPVTVEEGTNVLAGTRKSGILCAWQEMKRNAKTGRIPKYWDGNAAERCVEVLRKHFSGHGERNR